MTLAPTQDLLVLVADVMQEKVLDALLTSRREALGIRSVTFRILVHPHRDPGVYRQAGALVRPFLAGYAHALVAADAQWDGSPGAAEVRRKIEQDLQAVDRPGDWCAAVVIDPELEAWAWRGTEGLRAALGITGARVRQIAEQEGWWPDDSLKPTHPKELFEAVLREAQKKRSSAVYADIARHMSLRDCHDPAFQCLVQTLRRWFPAT